MVEVIARTALVGLAGACGYAVATLPHSAVTVVLVVAFAAIMYQGTERQR